MTTVTGGANGCNASINSTNAYAFGNGTPITTTATLFVVQTAGGSYSFTGTGFSYTSSVPTSGTITGFTEKDSTGATVQTWTGFSVDWVSFWTAISPALSTGNYAAVNALFFNGDDTFNMQASKSVDYLFGGAGNDTFNYAGNLSGMTTIDGGAGTNTLNLDGDYGTATGYGLLGHVTNIQTVHMAGGHSYYIGGALLAGMTFDATALGAANGFTLDTSFASATMMVKGGAGNDTVKAGRGSLTFDAGVGNDTVDYSSAPAVTVDLSKTGVQSVGGGMGSETLLSVENVITSPNGGSYTGNASDNTFKIGHNQYPVVVNYTIDGGAGNDTVWFDFGLPLTGDQGGISVDLRQTGSGMITGFGGTISLSSVEIIVGTDRPDTFIGNAQDNIFYGGGLMLAGDDTVDYSMATGSMTYTVSQTDNTKISASGGGQGNDTLYGMSRIIGSNYGDVFNAAPGTHLTFVGGTGVDTITLSGNRSEYDLRNVGSGNFTLTGGYTGQAVQLSFTGVEKLQFADQSLVLLISGTAGNDQLVGTTDADTFDISQGGDDTVSALAGDDTIITNGALSPGDKIDGGAGSDMISDSGSYKTLVTFNADTIQNIETMSFSGSAVNIATNDANVAAGQTLTLFNQHVANFYFDGSAETDGRFSYYGNNGNNDKGQQATVIGGAGNDAFYGGWADDTFDGGAGDDYIDGSGGTNTASYAHATGGVKVSLLIAGPQAVGGGQGTDTILNVDNLTGSSYDDVLTGNMNPNVLNGGDGADTLIGGLGNDTLDGGSNVDTAVVSGKRSAYTITQTSSGNFTVVGPDGTDTLTNIEYLKFDDQTMRLLPGSGTAVNFTSDPSTYMAAIRDFDGNDLGGASSWKLIGTADVSGSGMQEHILFNRQIGRWAEVGTESDGKTYFSNYSWAGDTRVVGIYIDPLVTAGIVVKGSDTDSQRRFQNDLMIDNIHGILGENDYNHDGLQEVYFSLTDGTAYLHAYMWADGNIQYANYQSKQQVIDYLTTNGWAASTWAGWFPAGTSASQTANEPITANGNVYSILGKDAVAGSALASAC